MRNLTIILLVLVFRTVNAQDKWAYGESGFWEIKNIETAIREDLDTIKVKIYEGIVKGELAVIDFIELRKRAGFLIDTHNIESIVQIPYLKNNENPFDMISVSIRRAVKSDFSGLVFFVDGRDIDSIIIKEQLSYLDSLPYMYASHFLGWVDSTGLKKVLSNEEFDLFNAYKNQLKSLKQVSHPSVEWMFLSENIDHSNIFGSESKQKLTQYYEALLSEVFWTTSKAGIEQEDFNKYFFKDQNYLEPYDSIESYINEYKEVIVPNPYNPLDPYDIIFMAVETSIGGIELEMIRIERRQSDFHIVGFARSKLTNDEIPDFLDVIRTVRLKWHPVYFSFSRISKLLRPYDYIVLEALLEEIAK